MKQVNNEIYNAYGDRWYTAYDDPIALLRVESQLKTPWVVQKIKQSFPLCAMTQVLDVGCGAGFLSNALALETLDVTGLDLSEESLKVAARHDQTKSVKYVKADAINLPYEDEHFDVVTAMDFLEHIDHPDRVIREFSRVLKPQGLFIFHTFNRNPLAYLVVIKLVEWLVKNTPPDIHVLRLFIKPAELEQYCSAANMRVHEMVGIKPVLSTIPLKNVLSGIVPQSLRFELTKSLLLSYMGYAKKN